MTNDRPDLSSEGAPAIDKTILVNVNRNKYPVVRPTRALKPGLTDRLVVGRNVTLTLSEKNSKLLTVEVCSLQGRYKGWLEMVARLHGCQPGSKVTENNGLCVIVICGV
jgi:hypothetical protein